MLQNILLQRSHKSQLNEDYVQLPWVVGDMIMTVIMCHDGPDLINIADQPGGQARLRGYNINIQLGSGLVITHNNWPLMVTYGVSSL